MSDKERTDDYKNQSKIEKIEAWLTTVYDWRRNLVRQVVEFKRKEDGEGDWREFTDEDEMDILYELNRMNYTKPEGMLRVILGSSHILAYNPIADYFESHPLKKPGQVRRLMDAVVLDDSIVLSIQGKNYRQLFEEYFVKWLKACYLCMTGRNKNDVMLILIGAQGRFKTSFLNYLTPPDLKDYSMTGNIEPSLQNYNTATYLTDRVFINVDDQMENIFGKDYNSMKSIISQDLVSRRTLYSRRARNQRRIANFCGSVNESHFLRDSHNRRYLCFKIRDIKEEYSQVDMDDVWAEVRLMVEEEKAFYIFHKEDYQVIDAMNENYIAPTEEAEFLSSVFLPVKREDEDDETLYMQFSEILNTLKSVTSINLKSYNLQTALRKYGFECRQMKKKRLGNSPRQLYALKLITEGRYFTLLFDQLFPYRNPPAAEPDEEC